MSMEQVFERYARLRELSRANFSQGSTELIDRALLCAAEMLGERTRYDGTPLLDHSVRTAEIVISDLGLGRNSAISTIMHDVVRLGLMSAEEVGAQFGEACTTIIKGLCNISDIHPKVSDEQAENTRELIISYSTDPRIILIKLADRLEVMRSLSISPRANAPRRVGRA